MLIRDDPLRWVDDRRQNRGLEVEEIAGRLAMLKLEHRDLDNAIDALGLVPASDQLQMARLKKRKLRLKDEIAQLEDQAIPDLIA